MNADQDQADGPVGPEPQNPDQHQSAKATTFWPRRSRHKVVLVAGTCLAVVIVVIAAGLKVQVRAASAGGNTSIPMSLPLRCH